MGRFDAFFAENVQDLNGLDANILSALHECAALIVVLHPRGTIEREKAKMPRIGDTYRRPSSEVWKKNRNRLSLSADLRSDLDLAYLQIGSWQDIADSGVHPNYGSPALNVATSSLASRLPILIDALKKLRR
jgi:predicted NAD/FAD-binding protein